MSMEINSNVTSQIMDLKTFAQGVSRKNDKATNNVEEYYEKLCKKFPQISFNTGGTCSANKVVVNISPECLKKMANDPEFAKEVEWNLSGEVAANAQIHSWARRDGIEVYGRTVAYDANGKRESGYGMRTANTGNSSTSKAQNKSDSIEEHIRKKREEKEEMEARLEEKRKKKEEFEERLKEMRQEREAYLEHFVEGNSSLKQYQSAEMTQVKPYLDTKA
ncbi:MAG: hypothetical protein IKW30_08225 [Lachnospiraceae bacterium]|nr:hypothetical protein [Lachnospiraceae bacterium]